MFSTTTRAGEGDMKVFEYHVAELSKKDCRRIVFTAVSLINLMKSLRMSCTRRTKHC